MSELMHFGVKGQQWGVRHGPPYPIDPENAITRIKKGTTFKRLSVRDETVAKGHAYVTFLKNDTKRYKGFFGARLKAINKGATVYSHTMEAKKDMLSPSKKERVETFLELHREDPIIAKELGKYHKGDFHHFTPLPSKFYERQYSKLNEKELRSKGYDTFVAAIGGNEYIRSKYFEKLANKGYSFVTDDMDAGRFGVAPSIILDRQRSVKYKGREEVSNATIYDTWRTEGTYLKKDDGRAKRG